MTEREVTSTKPQAGRYATVRSRQQSNTHGKMLEAMEDVDADINVKVGRADAAPKRQLEVRARAVQFVAKSECQSYAKGTSSSLN